MASTQLPRRARADARAREPVAAHDLTGPVSADPWGLFWRKWDGLKGAVARSKVVNVNTGEMRGSAQELVQEYFRNLRPELARGVNDDDLRLLDDAAQDLLRLAQGRNARKSYARVLKKIGGQRASVAVARERHFSEAAAGGSPQKPALSHIESRILSTLQSMLPEPALSYEQAIRDLRAQDRLSYRGTAVELREVMREVLDHLAPDDEVLAAPGFKLEKDRSGPTMRQKMSHILKSRGLGATSRKAPQDASAIVDELTASFVRSTYERGSAATHISPTLQDVHRLKTYVDAALMELLEAT